MRSNRTLARGAQARVEQRVRDILDTGAPDAQPAGELTETALASAHSSSAGSRAAQWVERRGLRFAPDRRGVIALGAVAIVVALLVGGWVVLSRPHSNAVEPQLSHPTGVSGAVSSRPAAGVGSARASPTGAVLVVDVVGKVRHSGVYRLPSGARVGDAVRAAGGALPGVDLTSLNLARRLTDGEQVGVGMAAGAARTPTAVDQVPMTAGSTSSGPIDLNSATAEQLDTLPGVGPVLAQHILDWRSAHGRFDSVDQLRSVSGIGPSKFATLRPLVTV